MPTKKQAIAALILCQYITNNYQKVRLFRFDPDRKLTYIITGSKGNIEAIVYPDGSWKYDDEGGTLQELRDAILARRDDRQAWEDYASYPRDRSYFVSADTPTSEQEGIIKGLFLKNS
ncbi:MAG: hypothetical protein QNJ38_03180 [Prochloraceae cyanobacterium]|nr:hypothetical protein [Prochloraceae cyanobacterium]